jgi:hypothetical protein
VFTAPKGGPLSRADFVKLYFRPAIRAANEAIAQLPKEQRPAPLPDRLRFYDLRHTCASLLIAAGRERQGGPGAARPCDGQHHARHLQAPVPIRDGHPRRPAGAGPGRSRDPAERTQHGPADNRLGETAGERPDQVAEAEGFEPSREREPPTRFPGVCLRPLGQASAGSLPKPPGAPRHRAAGPLRRDAHVERGDPGPASRASRPGLWRMAGHFSGGS